MGAVDLLEFQAEDALVDVEHSLERFLEREVNPERFVIDGVFLLLELVVVIAEVPDVDLRLRIVCLGGFQFAQLRHFGVELRLSAGDEIVDVIFGAGAPDLAILISV